MNRIPPAGSTYAQSQAQSGILIHKVPTYIKTYVCNTYNSRAGQTLLQSQIAVYDNLEDAARCYSEGDKFYVVCPLDEKIILEEKNRLLQVAQDKERAEKEVLLKKLAEELGYDLMSKND